MKRYQQENSFNYLQCQGGYDEGPGKSLLSFITLFRDDYQNLEQIKEVRLKVFLKEILTCLASYTPCLKAVIGKKENL